MVREIKFRCYDKLNGMVCDPGFGVREKTTQFNINRLFLSPGVEFMQFTGLKDKNGKEIYEGDIVTTGEGFIGQVIYSVDNEFGSAEWLIDVGDWEECLTTPLKIVGNIYENPELLKETN